MQLPNVLTPSGNVTIAAAVVLVVLLGINYVYHLRPARLPPGPKAGWFGSVKLPQTYQWLTYAKWRKVYGECVHDYHGDVINVNHVSGDIIYVYVFRNPIVILNSADAINDLFEKRSAIYSSRPVRTMVNDL